MKVEKTTAERAAGRNLKWPGVYHGVLARIEGGDLAPGAVATDTDLAREFEVDKVTADRALARLARDGHLELRQGAGYVVPMPGPADPRAVPVPALPAPPGELPDAETRKAGQCTN